MRGYMTLAYYVVIHIPFGVMFFADAGLHFAFQGRWRSLLSLVGGCLLLGVAFLFEALPLLLYCGRFTRREIIESSGV